MNTWPAQRPCHHHSSKLGSPASYCPQHLSPLAQAGRAWLARKLVELGQAVGPASGGATDEQSETPLSAATEDPSLEAEPEAPETAPPKPRRNQYVKPASDDWDDDLVMERATPAALLVV